MTIAVEGLSRRFGPGAAALDDVSLALEEGEFAALLGPSGSGKTTLLRILAGLDFPDAGRVWIGGRDMSAVPAQGRGVGVVFQHYALFRHMSVFENVAFGLRVRPRRLRPHAAEIARRVRELLELVRIPELANRRPDQISGGQRQRVALARALAIEPRVLLLDEPFGALDALVRKEVRRWVRGLHDRLGLTSLLVTHDQEEAMELADRVAVMEGGRLVQLAPPAELLAAPATAFVARFLGDAARLEGEARGGRLHLPALGLVLEAALPDGPVQLAVRPEELEFGPPLPGRPHAQALRRHPVTGRVLAERDGLVLEGVAAGPLRAGEPCSLRLLGALALPPGEAPRHLRWAAHPLPIRA